MTKRFPGVTALDDVSFGVEAGEVHAVVGENGAGKSTLINILSGVIRPDAGHIHLLGKPIVFPNPVAARRAGIIAVHQEADLFPTLSVAENMALGQGLPTRAWGRVDWPGINRQARRAVQAVGQDIDVRREAARLSVAHRHMTQVSYAVMQQARLVILDEPTSALSAEEARWLFRQIELLKEAGAGIVYISHRQDEIFRLSDRITVLRDGKHIATSARDDFDPPRLVQAMVGRAPRSSAAPRDPERHRATAATDGEVVLSLRHYTGAENRFRHVNLDLRAGEVVGVYGLIGAGRTELAESVFGVRAGASGTLLLRDKPVNISSPRQAVARGISLAPEDRLRQGILPHRSVQENVVLASLRAWFVSRRREDAAADWVARTVSVQCRSLRQSMESLSGGNQQKVVLGRWLLTQPQVLLLDEPTRGVDVRAKAEIHEQIRQLARQGCAILLISSDLAEALEHSDRLLVFREGEVVRELDPRSTTSAEVATAALPLQSAADDAAVSPRHRLGGGTRIEYILLAVTLALWIWLGLTSDHFHLINLVEQASLWVILGLAAATVIIAGGIDISLGSLVALSAASAALTLRLPLPPLLGVPAAVAAAMIVGTLGGMLNGAVSVAGRVHPIVVTLGTMTIFRGMVFLLTGNNALVGIPRVFGALASGKLWGLPGSLVVAILTCLMMQLWLSQYPSGRHLYAVGSSPQAARLAGISRRRGWLLAFAVGGSLAGLAGALQLASSEQMQPELAAGWELKAIAVAVIGGVAISGGRGSVLGVICGALLLETVDVARLRWGIVAEQETLFVGAMILAAILLNQLWQSKWLGGRGGQAS